MSNLSKEAVALLKNNAEVREILSLLLSEVVVDDFIKLHTTQPVRFKDFHGNEVMYGDIYYTAHRTKFTFCGWECTYNTEQPCELFHYFKFEPDAKDWIELNKPCGLSVNEIVEWAGTYYNESPDKKRFEEEWTKNILELIRKKEAK